jgi:hypothetical protein
MFALVIIMLGFVYGVVRFMKKIANSKTLLFRIAMGQFGLFIVFVVVSIICLSLISSTIPRDRIKSNELTVVPDNNGVWCTHIDIASRYVVSGYNFYYLDKNHNSIDTTYSQPVKITTWDKKYGEFIEYKTPYKNKNFYLLVPNMNPGQGEMFLPRKAKLKNWGNLFKSEKLHTNTKNF